MKQWEIFDFPYQDVQFRIPLGGNLIAAFEKLEFRFNA